MGEPRFRAYLGGSKTAQAAGEAFKLEGSFTGIENAYGPFSHCRHIADGFVPDTRKDVRGAFAVGT
jgi:hypothetical protein